MQMVNTLPNKSLDRSGDSEFRVIPSVGLSPPGEVGRWVARPRSEVTTMKLMIQIGLVVIILSCFVSTAIAQKPALILDQIAQSLPQMDHRWKYNGTEVYERGDGSTQARIRWSNGKIEWDATVIVHPTVKRAQRAFQLRGKEDIQEGFRIDGVGEEAFLWPPKVPEAGAYNIRFRKAQVEVWISGGSEDDVKRYALAIAASVAPPNKRMQRSAASEFRIVP